MSEDQWTYLLGGLAIAISLATIVLNVLTRRRIQEMERAEADRVQWHPNPPLGEWPGVSRPDPRDPQT